MNTRYKGRPEIISNVRILEDEGDEEYLGDKVTGIQVTNELENGGAIVQIDVRGTETGKNLLIEFELAELVAAISFATLNAERDE